VQFSNSRLQPPDRFYIIALVYRKQEGGGAVARRFDKFTKPFQDSKIPFLLAEIVTNGSGEMVDLICRFLNEPAARLASSSPEEIQNHRFCQLYASGRLELFAPLAEVAFSGSSATFSYETLLGRRLRITCYQPMYGLAACILEEETGDGPDIRPAGGMRRLSGSASILEVGRDGVHSVSFSQRLCELSGYSRRELLNRCAGELFQLVLPEDRNELLQILLDAAKSGIPAEHEFRLLCKDGQARWVALRAERLSAEGGTAVFHAILTDIDRWRACQDALTDVRRELAESQAQLERVFSEMPGGYALFSLPGEGKPAVPLRVSRGLAELTGYTPAELLRRLATSPYWRVHADDRDALAAALAADDGEPIRALFRFQQKGGAYHWLSLRAARRPDGDGASLLYAVFADVDDAQEERRRLQLQTELCGLLLTDTETVCVDYNPAADVAEMEIFRPEGQQLSRQIPEYRKSVSSSSTIHPDFRRLVQAQLRSACSKPQKGTFLYRGNYGNQDFQWHQASYVSLADRQGNVCRVILRARNISREKAEQERFGAALARWEASASGALASLRLDLSADRSLDLRSGSSYLVQILFGNSASECLAHFAENIPDETERLRCAALFSPDALRESYAQGESLVCAEHPFRTAEGMVLWVRTQAELRRDPVSLHLEAALRTESIDARKRGERMLEAVSGQRFEAVCCIDAATRCLWLRRPAAEGSTEEGDYYKTALALIDSRVVPSERKRLRSSILLPNILRHLKKEPSYSVLCPLQEEDGSRRTLLCGFSWLDPDRTLLATALDVTQLLASGEETTRALEQEAEQLRSADSLRHACLSHLNRQFQGPSDALARLSEQALRSAEDPAQLAACLEKISVSARYLSSLSSCTPDIQEMEGGKITLRREEFSPRKLAGELQELVPALAEGRGLRFTCTVAPETDDRCVGDEARLRQLLLNLLSNAVRFTPDGGHLSLEVCRLRRERGKVWLQFVVSDSGCGIPAKLLPRLFEPAAPGEDQPEGRGDGLGLAVCRRLADLMGGSIAVSSIVGVGSKFTLEAPFGVVYPEKRTGIALPLAGKIILLADAGPETESAARTLEKLGCAAERADSGLQALQQFVSHPAGYYAAILLGRQMSVMDGPQTAAAIRGWDRPDARSVPIFILAESGDVPPSGPDAASGWLSGPVTEGALLRCLESCASGEEA